MNKKKVNLLLGIAVLVIWGGSAYRLISGLNDNDEPMPAAAPLVQMPAEDYTDVPDTAKLLLHYRDPFGLATLPAKRDSSIMRKNTIRIPLKTLVPPADMSFVRYAGYIANPGAKQTIVMLLINGRTVMMKEGESAEGIRLIRNMRDSVKVIYHNQVRFIVKASS